jgi:hypothetical protein
VHHRSYADCVERLPRAVSLMIDRHSLESKQTQDAVPRMFSFQVTCWGVGGPPSLSMHWLLVGDTASKVLACLPCQIWIFVSYIECPPRHAAAGAAQMRKGSLFPFGSEC